MSYDIIKSITIKEDKVFITSACNNLRPLYFTRDEWTGLSEKLQLHGEEALYKVIGTELWSGNIRIRKGSVLCNLLKYCYDYLHNTNKERLYIGPEIAGTYIGKMVSTLKREKLKEKNFSDLVLELKATITSKEYILEMAEKGEECLGNSRSLEEDHSFVIQALKHAGTNLFSIPKIYNNDREIAMIALENNGCIYRLLSPQLQQEEEIIFKAFTKRVHQNQRTESLIKLIPMEYFTDNKPFIIKLLNVCPFLNWENTRCLAMFNDKDIVLEAIKTQLISDDFLSRLPSKWYNDQEVLSELLSKLPKTYSAYKELLMRKKSICENMD